MSRPPIEWPIPVYVAELRERVVATFRLPTRYLSGRVPGPLSPEVISGHALLSVALSNGRCVKSSGTGRVFASEFHLAELFTPVRWRGACRPAVRGNFLMGAWADRSGLRRLVRVNQGSVAAGSVAVTARGGRIDCELADASPLLRFALAKPVEEAPWPQSSLLDTQEAADVLTVHPECYFLPEPGGRAVNAVPLHQYARSTTHVQPEDLNASGLEEALGLPAGVLQLDHMLFQKRCTHTWSFPPERIPVTQPAPYAKPGVLVSSRG